MLNSLMASSYEPPRDVQKFTEWLQWVLGDQDDVKLERWAVSETPYHMVKSEMNTPMSESIYRFCGGGARFQINIMQLSDEEGCWHDDFCTCGCNEEQE